MIRHSRTITKIPDLNDKNWYFFYYVLNKDLCVLNKDLNDYIKSFLQRLIEKEKCDLKKLVSFGLQTESQNNKPASILTYRKVFDKEVLDQKINEFTIFATITTSDVSCYYRGKIDYNLKVYDKDNRCIIEHTCKAPISYIEINNNILKVYYVKQNFNHHITKIDSWNLDWNKKKEEILKSANCLEFTLIYHCAKGNISKTDLNPWIENIFNKCESSRNTLPSPHD